MISMNYENVYRYLCFCCADAMDCGCGIAALHGLCVGRYGLGGVPRPVDTALKPV